MNLEVFSRKVALPVSAGEAFAWHERPGALDRLIPPWENMHIVSRGDGIRNGSRVVLIIRQGPLPLCWVAEHCDYEPGTQFRDIQIRGPFRHWDHTHRFIVEGRESSVLEDHIEYCIRGGMPGKIIAGRLIRKKIASIFAYRHRTTAGDLAVHGKHRQQGLVHVAITGSHGLIGRALVPLLTTGATGSHH